MVAKIDNNAQKFKKKLRTNDAKNRQKIKNTILNSRFTGFKKEQCISILSTFEKLCNLQLFLT